MKSFNYRLKNLQGFVFGLIALLFMVQTAFGQASIVTNPNDTQITTALTGSGLGITNPSLERGQRATQVVTFANGIAGAGFGIDGGVLFSTGNATNDLTTKNVRAVTSVSPTNTGTDPNLMLINPSAAFNTVAYSFDITLDPTVNGIRIVFQFGSEEYPDYVGSVFNDLFGFFISGPGITGTQNVALLPSNNDVIAVNSVNGGVVGDQGEADYLGLNLGQTEFYINNGHRNDGGPNINPQPGPIPVHIEYNGITTAITRDIGGLVPGQTYRFKVAIADVGDGSYDSGVLLKQIVGLRSTDLSIEKTVNDPAPVVGDTVTFTLKASNKNIPEGSAVSQAEVIDLLPSGYTFVSASSTRGNYDELTGLWNIGAMGLGAEEILTIEARVNPEGDYRNLARIEAVDAVDLDQTDNFDEETVIPVPQDPAFTLIKLVTSVTDALDVVRPTGAFEAIGDKINYSITVANSGNLLLTDVEINDPLTGFSQTIASFAPGTTVVFPTVYTVVQSDLDAGLVLNTATAQGDDPNGTPIYPDLPNDGQVITPGTQSPSLSFSKEADVSALSSPVVAGDEVTYTFTVTNTGNVTMNDITLSEENFSGTGTVPAFGFVSNSGSSAEGTLVPGEVATYSFTYTLTQADIDAGGVENLASVIGTPPTTDPTDPAQPITPVPSTPDPNNPGTPGDPGVPTEVDLPANPSLSFSKEADVSALSSPVVAGDEITYTFTVTNTGNVTMEDITVVDPLPGMPAVTLDATTLAPGAVATGSAVYTITQADIDGGEVVNLATVTGTPPTTDPTDPAQPITPVPSTPDPNNPGTPGDPGVPTEVDLPANPSLSFSKEADVSALSSPVVAGDEITYTFTVTNTGNVTMEDITVVDPLPGMPAVTLDATTLAPGAVATGSAVYTITQADIDGGEVVNLATVTGTPPTTDPTDPAQPITPVPSTPDPNNPGTPGDPGVPTEVDLPANPSLSFSKEADTSALSSPVVAGDEITYTFTVTNTGNVTMEDITVVDPLPGMPAVTLDATTLAPGAVATGSAVYTITQADIDGGEVVNLATVTGTPPTTDPTDPAQPITPVPSTPDPNNPGTPGDPGVPTEVDLPANPSLSFSKEADVSALSSPVVAGDEITYTFTVTNTGNVTMNDITLSEENFSGTGTVPAFGFVSNSGSSAEGILVPGEVASYAFTYALTQSDIDAGGVENLASVTGTPPTTDPTDPAQPITPVPSTPDPNNPGTPGDPVPTEVDLPANPSLSFSKEADVSALSSPVVAGDEITYTFTVTNTGNVTMNDITLSEENFSGTGTVPAFGFVSNSGSSAEGILVPGEVASYAFTYALTQSDIDAGGVENLASVTGTPPTTDPLDPAQPITPVPSTPDPSNPGTPGDPGVPTIVETEQNPELSLTKTSLPGTHSKLGDVITYSLVLTNTGNVTITDIVLKDDNADVGSITPAAIAELEVGANINIKATHTITQSDLDKGGVYNIAIATGKDPKGKEVTTTSNDPSPVDPADPNHPGVDPDCPECTVTPIVKTPIVAEPDTPAPINGKEGGNTPSVMENDKLNGKPVVPEEVILTPGTPVDKEGNPVPGISMDPDGKITVDPETPGGEYEFPYTICEVLNPGNCSTTIVTIVVTTPPIVAEPDTPAPINGKEGGKTPSVLENDKLNGKPVVPEEVILTPGTPVDKEGNPVPGISMDPDGKITVDPETPGGEYEFPYTICEVLNPGNCSTTIVTIVVETPPIVAEPDTPAPINGKEGGKTPSVLENDKLNGKPVVPEEVILTPGTPVDKDGKPVPGITMHPDGTITVDPETPGGEYEYPYTICEVLNPGNCSTTTVTIVVGQPVIKANDDRLKEVDGTIGQINAGNVLDNNGSGEDTVNGKPATLSNVTIAVKTTANPIGGGQVPILDPATGIVRVPANTPAGAYTIEYVICDKLNGDNCSTATVSLTVIGKDPEALEDRAETFQNTPVIIPILDNDEKGSADFDLKSVVITKQPAHGTLTLHPDGTVTYTPNDGYTGEDNFSYTVKDKNGVVSNEANVTVIVEKTTPEANDDRAETEFNKEVIIPILSNDKGNGAELDHSSIVIKEQPRNGTVRVNADGTVSYVPNPGYTGSDSFSYTVKDANGNETNVAYVEIEVTGFFIPNVFTPNGDGNNDVFEIVGLDQYERAEVTIFNRWGNEVYRNPNYKNNWDGGNLNEGTYYYLIRLTKEGQESVHKGWVLLKR